MRPGHRIYKSCEAILTDANAHGKSRESKFRLLHLFWQPQYVNAYLDAKKKEAKKQSKHLKRSRR